MQKKIAAIACLIVATLITGLVSQTTLAKKTDLQFNSCGGTNGNTEVNCNVAGSSNGASEINCDVKHPQPQDPNGRNLGKCTADTGQTLKCVIPPQPGDFQCQTSNKK